MSHIRTSDVEHAFGAVSAHNSVRARTNDHVLTRAPASSGELKKRSATFQHALALEAISRFANGEKMAW
jgi:hypothetical protein